MVIAAAPVSPDPPRAVRSIKPGTPSEATVSTILSRGTVFFISTSLSGVASDGAISGSASGAVRACGDGAKCKLLERRYQPK